MKKVKKKNQEKEAKNNMNLWAYDIDLYDKDGNLITGLKKYIRNERHPEELYDREISRFRQI